MIKRNVLLVGVRRLDNGTLGIGVAANYEVCPGPGELCKIRWEGAPQALAMASLHGRLSSRHAWAEDCTPETIQSAH